MARIPEEDISRIREATDIVALVSERVVLKQKGRLFWGCCPFHQEKTPSFKVDPATSLWHCFGCGEGGDAFGYLMKSENLTFLEAVVMLAQRAHIEIKTVDDAGANQSIRNQVFAVCKDTAEYYHSVLTRGSSGAAADARQYLSGRGFGSSVAAQWKLGYAPGRGMLVAHLRQKGHQEDAMIEANVALKSDRNTLRDRFFERVIFPIFDLQGRPIAFGGRIVGQGQPKYLNTTDTPVFHKSANMYGLNVAKNAIVQTKTSLVVEGYTDVIALHCAGYTHAVATLGTALTAQHVKLLSRFAQRIVYVFDGDEAGLRAADRAVEFIDETITPEATKNPVMLDVVVLPAGSDPADLASSPQGIGHFDDLLAQAKPLITFALERRLSRYDLSRPEQQMRALEDCATILAPIKTSVMAAGYGRDLSDMLSAQGSSIDNAQVMSAIARARVSVRRDEGDTDGIENRSYKDAPSSHYSKHEVELLGLMMANPAIRARAATAVCADMFTDALLREMFALIAGADSKRSAKELLGGCMDVSPTVTTLFSGYDFDAAGRADIVVGEEYVRNIANSYYQRMIRTLKARLRKESGKEAKQQLTEQIVSFQRKIVDTTP